MDSRACNFDANLEPHLNCEVRCIGEVTAMEFAVAKPNKIDVAFALAMGDHVLLDLGFNQRW